MHDLADRREGRLVETASQQQHLERAAVALVRELRLEHIEAQLTPTGFIPFRRHELERGVRIDEAPNQPSRADAIHMDLAPRDPDMAGTRHERRGYWRGCCIRPSQCGKPCLDVL